MPCGGESQTLFHGLSATLGSASYLWNEADGDKCVLVIVGQRSPLQGHSFTWDWRPNAAHRNWHFNLLAASKSAHVTPLNLSWAWLPSGNRMYSTLDSSQQVTVKITEWYWKPLVLWLNKYPVILSPLFPTPAWIWCVYKHRYTCSKWVSYTVEVLYKSNSII